MNKLINKTRCYISYYREALVHCMNRLAYGEPQSWTCLRSRRADLSVQRGAPAQLTPQKWMRSHSKAWERLSLTQRASAGPTTLTFTNQVSNNTKDDKEHGRLRVTLIELHFQEGNLRGRQKVFPTIL